MPSGGGGVRLIISAKDKLSWIIAPIFHYGAGDYGGGLAYANSNVFGGNKKFLVIGQYTTAHEPLVPGVPRPQIRNTRFYYRVDVLVRRDRHLGVRRRQHRQPAHRARRPTSTPSAPPCSAA